MIASFVASLAASFAAVGASAGINAVLGLIAGAVDCGVDCVGSGGKSFGGAPGITCGFPSSGGAGTNGVSVVGVSADGATGCVTTGCGSVTVGGAIACGAVVPSGAVFGSSGCCGASGSVPPLPITELPPAILSVTTPVDGSDAGVFALNKLRSFFAGSFFTADFLVFFFVFALDFDFLAAAASLCCFNLAA